MAKPAPVIRKATPDAPGDAFKLIEEYYDAANVVARDDRASLLATLAHPHSGVWLAYVGEEPVGCILLRPLVNISSAAGEVKRLYVRPPNRGDGIASLLLNSLETFAKQHKLEWLYLDTNDDFADAIRFYERHLYERCERYNDNPQATIFMRKHLQPGVTIRAFQPGDEAAFRSLNEAWITKYFSLEEKDYEVLGDPQKYVLADGGYIAIAIRDAEAVGCCALLAMGDRGFEIGKMAVSESLRGQGIGRKLLDHVIQIARGRGAKRLYLETNSNLKNAVHLYESIGFRKLDSAPSHESPYARADVHMEMWINKKS